MRHAPTAGAPRPLLLPTSLGLASLVLLHLLSAMRARQLARTRRAGFALHVLHFYTDNDGRGAAERRIAVWRDRFPEHEYSIVSLADIADTSALGTRHTAQIDSSVKSRDTAAHNLAAALSSQPSPSSRADLVATLLRTAVLRHARALGCTGVLWADCTTTLSAKVLSATAQGRGAAVAWQVRDGAGPDGMHASYPLRDLLRGELEAYAAAVTPSLVPLVVEEEPVMSAAKSSTTTIEALMREYIVGAERGFPNIVANVVRTADKLRPEPVGPATRTCTLCEVSVPGGAAAFGLSGWGGYPQLDHEEEHETQGPAGSKDLCYGCTRMMLGSKR